MTRRLPPVLAASAVLGLLGCADQEPTPAPEAEPPALRVDLERRSRAPVPAGSRSEGAGPTAGAASTPLTPEEQVLRELLADAPGEAVLHRVTGWAARRTEQIWHYGEGDVERPNPGIPHRRIDRAARAELAALVGPRTQPPGQTGRLLGYSYLLELVDGGAPIARLDVHTEGEGQACLFLIDASRQRLEEGYAKLHLSPDDREAWLEALDRVWERASAPR